MPPENYDVIKVFNNNVVLTKHRGVEKILIKKGLGFGRNTGDTIDCKTTFDKVFIIESLETSSKFNQLISQIDASLVGICEEVLFMISSETGQQVGEEVHIKLIDHIAFALYRLQNNDCIENPFYIEIETLYSQEVAIAKKAAEILQNNTGLTIPDAEVGFIALHIHSLKNQSKLSNTIKYAFLCNSVMELIEDECEIEIDRKSIDYARFITHIRFAVERIIKKIPIKNDLLASIKKTYKSSYQLSKKVSRLLEKELTITVPDTETGYIAMHIERLINISNYNEKK